MILFSHPTGNENVRAALSGFLNAGLLCEFDTAIASFDGTLLDKLSSLGPLAEIKRRRFEPGLKEITNSYPYYETARLLSAKMGLRSLIKHETGVLSIDNVYRRHDLYASRRIKQLKGKIKGVYAYEDGCIASFNAAKKQGIKCLYDLPIGYWRTSKLILEEEAKRWPEWASTLGGIKNSQAKLDRKDEELALADHIYVASSFTANSLKNYPGKLAEVNVIPYGFPAVLQKREYAKIDGRRLKLLFVGGLSQRKGIAGLFEVAQKLSAQVSLTVVGNKPVQPCPALDAALSNCTWISSMPNHKILALMREHDVFVFPSVFEGFGLVITEAMSQGTPVIATYNTAGADLIHHDVNGWLISAGNTSQLQQAIEKLIAQPDKVISAGMEAMKTAAQRPWYMYGKELAGKVRDSLI